MLWGWLCECPQCSGSQRAMFTRVHSIACIVGVDQRLGGFCPRCFSRSFAADGHGSRRTNNCCFTHTACCLHSILRNHCISDCKTVSLFHSLSICTHPREVDPACAERSENDVTPSSGVRVGRSCGTNKLSMRLLVELFALPEHLQRMSSLHPWNIRTFPDAGAGLIADDSAV